MEHPDPTYKLYGEKFLMMDTGTVRNM